MPRNKGDVYSSKKFAIDRIKYYWERKRTYDTVKKSFEDDKVEFYQEMDRYFDSIADDEGKVSIDLKETVSGIQRITCQRISQVEVKFDIKKLRKVLTREQQKKVIRRHYQVNNWPGLLSLLKESGVDWNEFLKFVTITEDTNNGEIEKLVELGEIDVEFIKKCSNSRIKTQYYKIIEK